MCHWEGLQIVKTCRWCSMQRILFFQFAGGEWNCLIGQMSNQSHPVSCDMHVIQEPWSPSIHESSHHDFSFNNGIWSTRIEALTPFARWLKAEVTEEVKQLKANFNLLESNGWNGKNWWFQCWFSKLEPPCLRIPCWFVHVIVLLLRYIHAQTQT